MSIVDKILGLSFPVLNHWGYWILLLAAMLEALPLFGLLVPGQFIAIIGGIGWAISFVMFDYIFGSGYEIASKYIGKFIFIAIVLSISLISLYRFVNKRKHIFTKYLLYALVLNIFSLYMFSKMIEDVVERELVTKLDIWLNAKIVLLWNPLLNEIMTFITNLVSPSHLFILSLILFCVLIYKKKWYYSLLLLFSMIGGLLFETLTKFIIHRARPENALIEVSGYSFPSGHATMAIIFFSLLLYSFKEDIKSRVLKNIFIASNIILFLLVGLSRVYLNVHWFSDVLAGFSLGLFWLTLLILVFKVIISLVKKTDMSLAKIKDGLKKYIDLAKKLNHDKRVPKIPKILLGLAVGYFFLPFDIIPDLIPVLGHLDDLIIIPSLLFLAIIFIPKKVFYEHYNKIFSRDGLK